MAEDIEIDPLAKILLTAPVVIAIAVVGAMLWWVAISESPEEVNLPSAVSQLEDPTIAAPVPDVATGSDTGGNDAEDTTDRSAGADGTHPDPTADADGSAGDATTDTSNIAAEPESQTLADITGVWNLDTSIGDYDYEKATGSFAGFRVNEVLTFLDESTAVGRTGEVSGTITIADNTLTAADVTVKTNKIDTDRPIRDRKMHQALKTDRFPTAVFKLVEPVPLPAGAAAGDEFTVQANGDLTIAGIRRKAEFRLEAQLADDVLVVVGSSDVRFADHDIKTPTAPVVLSVEDQGIIEFQLLFTRTS